MYSDFVPGTRDELAICPSAVASNFLSVHAGYGTHLGVLQLTRTRDRSSSTRGTLLVSRRAKKTPRTLTFNVGLTFVSMF